MRAETFLARHGLSQSNLAGLLGLNKQTVGNYAHGASREPAAMRLLLDLLDSRIRAAKAEMPEAERADWEGLRALLRADAPAALLRRAVLALYGGMDAEWDTASLREDVAHDFLTTHSMFAGRPEYLDYMDSNGTWRVVVLATGQAYDLDRHMGEDYSGDEDYQVVIDRTLGPDAE